MQNPILTTMMGQRGNNTLAAVGNIKQFLSGKDPNAVFNMMMQSNPQFAQFVEQNKGKTPDQIAQEYGIDSRMLREILK